MNSVQTISNTNLPKILLIGLLLLILVAVATLYLPTGIGWHYSFRPASLALVSARSPYDVAGFYGAPWGLLPLVPFALLPENVGRAALSVLGAGVFAYTAYRLGAKPLAMVAFLLWPPVLHCLLNTDVEWLAMLGFVLPPQIGLFFIAVKPQVGVGVGVFWLAEAWRKGSIREVFQVFGPVSLALLTSFALFGLWPLKISQIDALATGFNASLWPIPVGLALLVASIRTRNFRYAMPSSPCLSPHVLFHSWAAALIAVASLPAETVAAVVGLWILVFIRASTGAL